MKRRDRLAVIFDILVTVRDHRNSVRFTSLLRASRLSSEKFSEYYSELLAKEFVKEIIDRKGGRYVTLTEKGFRYIERYNVILGLIDEFEL